MRLRLPSSLSGRLLAVAGVSTLGAIALVSLVMGILLSRFVVGQIDQRLDAQAFAIAAALRASDGTPTGAGAMLPRFDAPPFDRPRSGWTWRVEGPRGPIADSSRTDRESVSDFRPLDGPAPPPPPLDDVDDDANARPHGPDRADRLPSLHVRSFSVTIAGGELTIVVTAPMRAIYDPLRDALLPLLASMLFLGLVLLLATVVQVRTGLAPLERLRRSLEDVRSGRRAHVPSAQPREVAPLAAELNRLIDDGAESLTRARRHVANLAHGLKTPLAELAMTLRTPGRDPGGEASALVEAMDQRIRHHLARARVAAIGGAARAATPVGAHVGDLVDVLQRIHAERRLAIETAIPPSAVAAVEPQDLDEMLGNLLDNACKWASASVSVRCEAAGPLIVILVEDDGPGLEPDEMPEALRPGRRLDELTPGHGFGLPITRELAELYGGALTVGRSKLGGLSASLALPGTLG